MKASVFDGKNFKSFSVSLKGLELKEAKKLIITFDGKKDDLELEFNQKEIAELINAIIKVEAIKVPNTVAGSFKEGAFPNRTFSV